MSDRKITGPNTELQLSKTPPNRERPSLLMFRCAGFFVENGRIGVSAR